MSALPIQLTIDQLHCAGLMLSLTPEYGLRVSPASRITPTLRKIICNQKANLVDYLLNSINCDIGAANDWHEPFLEPPGYGGTGWRLAGAVDLSEVTIAAFRAGSLALDARQAATALGKLEAP